MAVPAHIRGFWEAFEAALGSDVPDRFYEAFHFGDNERDANDLAELVLAGTKRATASLLWSYEADGKPLPEAGAFSVVTGWDHEPLCVIETTGVSIVPYAQVTERFAAREGEGDRTLRFWREVHWAYFGRECARIGRTREPDMPVVCEAFVMVYSPASGLLPAH